MIRVDSNVIRRPIWDGGANDKELSTKDNIGTIWCMHSKIIEVIDHETTNGLFLHFRSITSVIELILML